MTTNPKMATSSADVSAGNGGNIETIQPAIATPENETATINTQPAPATCTCPEGQPGASGDAMTLHVAACALILRATGADKPPQAPQPGPVTPADGPGPAASARLREIGGKHRPGLEPYWLELAPPRSWITSTDGATCPYCLLDNDCVWDIVAVVPFDGVLRYRRITCECGGIFEWAELAPTVFTSNPVEQRRKPGRARLSPAERGLVSNVCVLKNGRACVTWDVPMSRRVIFV